MPQFVSQLGTALGSRVQLNVARHGALGIGLLAVIHLAAFAIMAATEIDLVGWALFILTWGLLNCLWLTLLRRPALSALLALAIIVVLVELSRFKSAHLWMTVSFVDLMVIDADTIAFLLMIFPKLKTAVIVAIVLAIPLAIATWRLDPFRVSRRAAAVKTAACLGGLIALAMAVPEEPWEAFRGDNYVSKFVRSGVTAASELADHGLFDAGAAVAQRLKPAIGETCLPASKPPHIIMVLDESSFDIRAVPGIKVPAGYGAHFRSFDGSTRSLLVEGAGGPTWYTEYNVLTGLSARSYGRFAYFVTRIAAGRVERGLPQALRRCGYKTFTLYPVMGAFLSAKAFQKTTGVERFIDAGETGAGAREPDRFYYDWAARLIERERAGGPLFLFTYLTANHFPWDQRFHPELTPEWRDPGNAPDVDEYIRRQTMSVKDYGEFVARLRRDFPDERFLILRFGDHQPNIAAKIISPALDENGIRGRLMAHDPRYFTTYYAIDAVNFHPVDLSSALDALDAPYLPLVVQEAAGLPLDPSFAEQKKILQRCGGLFYACAGGAEARLFNRLLINAGLIKRL
jgi:Sulfatase